MTETTLANAVEKVAGLSHAFTEADLEQPFRWRAHEEGVRFALIGAYHELQELAVQVATQRAQEGPPRTAAQRALARYHAAYRDLQAVLIGVDEEAFDRPPAPGEWSLRDVLTHTIHVERVFYSLVHYGLLRQREDPSLPVRFPRDRLEEFAGSHEQFEQAFAGGLSGALDYYRKVHGRTLREFAGMTGEELEGRSLWWEEEELPLSYRLHRFDAHLRQHTVQAEKVLAEIGRPPNEVLRLLRLVYNALASVEGAILGAEDVGREARQRLAETISERAEEAAALVAQARELAAAVQDGRREVVQTMLAEEPGLANAVDQQGLSLVLAALYRGHDAIVSELVEAGADLDIFDAAALGRLDVVQEYVEAWDGWVNEYGRDGFTPLQLACYFGQEETALWLLDHGAGVDAVAQNAQQIQPLHATAAGKGSLDLLQALLEHGADPNARQSGGFTVLHTAAGRGDVEMARLLLEQGADPAVEDDEGRTPPDLAREKGQERFVAQWERLARQRASHSTSSG